MSVSLLDSLVSLTAAQRRDLLAELSDEEAAVLLYDWDLWARDNQREPDVPWRIWLVLAGRGFGKTRVGAEWTRKQARTFEYVNIAGATADDARDIMIEGESGIMATCPAWERPEYRRSLRRLDWPSGAKSLIFTADEPERFRGKQHSKLWADELAAWRYEEAWDQAVLGLRLGTDPQALVTTTPKPRRLIRALVADPNCVVTKGSTYENRDNLPAAFFEELIGKYEGTRMGRQELDAELLLDEGMAYFFDERIHCVPWLEVPHHWGRGEGMDYGSSAATAWLVFATDSEGNHLCFDELYEPGWPSDTAPRVLARRAQGYQPQSWQAYDEDGWPVRRNVVWGDPQSMANSRQLPDRMGMVATVGQEFNDLNVPVTPANNHRDAGYVRVAELLKLQPERRFPDWHPRRGEPNAPRLFFIGDRCEHVVEQLKDALIEDKGTLAGRAVAAEWESEHGHAHAALRYWALSRTGPSKEPEQEPDDPRAALIQRRRERREKQPPDADYVEY